MLTRHSLSPAAQRKASQAIADDGARGADDCGLYTVSARKDGCFIHLLIDAKLNEEDRQRWMSVVERKRICLPPKQPRGERMCVFMAENAKACAAQSSTTSKTNSLGQLQST